MVKNKSDKQHNKGFHHKGQYNVMFFCTKGWAYKQKAHGNLCFPLRRAYLLLSCIYFYARVNSIPSYSNLNYSLVGKHHVVGKYPSIYGHSNIFDRELLLLTIIYMISKLGAETLSPYLSLCSMDAICSKNMLWVVVIMEDYMIVEYVEFAKSKLLHRPFLKIRWIAIVWWLRT